ncbi:MAG TPA: PAS domain-containing protein [Chryseosolibacter sp.]|nr:PAS domain-containing protein [Chryseosolibacter sp.]
MVEEKVKYHFLKGGGEMGNLTRAFDWSQTPVGPVEEWPQSLRTIVDVVLHSQVPMFLWWGDDMIQFYNDAYRPSLGENGKHPHALGQKAVECWPEIWPIIKPLIDHVKGGGSTWGEDQLIPIFRNGKIEDVYWTFGYSPVRDESQSIMGVLVICNETTKQVQTLQKVEENEKTLRSIVLHAPVGICILKGEPLKAEVVNDIFLQLYGKSREELESKPYWEVLSDLKEQYSGLFQNVILTGKPYHGKEQKMKVVRGGKEETVFVDFVIEGLELQEGSPNEKIMILAIDVTDKVMARKTIEESELRYKTLITESTVAIALYYGSEFRIQYVNEIMTGYWQKDSVIGKPLEEAVPEVIGQGFLDKFRKVYSSGEAYIGTEEPFAVDGMPPNYFNYIYKPLKNSDGTVYGIHHMAMDVTEQVIARKKIEQSEANLRNMILSAPVAMCILKGSALIVEIANDRMFSLWGKQPEGMLQRPLFDGLPEAKNQGFEEILHSVLVTGETYIAEAVPVSLPRDKGIKTVYANFVYEPFRDGDGQITGVLVVATDMTDQVRARQKVEEVVAERTKELWESNENLKRSNDELAQFAYIASHDLQEPARKISTFTEMLQKNLKEVDPRSKNLLNKIEYASARMLSLIRDVLTFSQLAKEKQQFRIIDLNEVLQSVKNDFELMIEEKGARISSDPLPVILGIPVQINQLFGNLISNALKFSDNRRRPEIAIRCKAISPEETIKYRDLKHGSAYYQISFRDNGIGFNQSHARQIFDIFQRLHGKLDYQGTGIGLAMCRKIAQNHNGDIYAESVEGQGATFHVLLPHGETYR